MSTTQHYGDYAIDIASEGLAYLFAKKISQANTLPDGAEKKQILREISMLQHEQKIFYGGGSNEDFESLMHKVQTVYNPIIKDAITNNRSIGYLPTE
ncbi:hypothetical protein FACS1894201_10590 [Bacteroidia bacterium]|nr:hypothetical protein FACS1894201_10590 [Bacteroidia bacterium]